MKHDNDTSVPFQNPIQGTVRLKKKAKKKKVLEPFLLENMQHLLGGKYKQKSLALEISILYVDSICSNHSNTNIIRDL